MHLRGVVGGWNGHHQTRHSPTADAINPGVISPRVPTGLSPMPPLVRLATPSIISMRRHALAGSLAGTALICFCCLYYMF